MLSVTLIDAADQGERSPSRPRQCVSGRAERRLGAPGTRVSRAGSGTQITQLALDHDPAQAACYCRSRPRATGHASGPRGSSCGGSRLDPLLMGVRRWTAAPAGPAGHRRMHLDFYEL